MLVTVHQDHLLALEFSQQFLLIHLQYPHRFSPNNVRLPSHQYPQCLQFLLRLVQDPLPVNRFYLKSAQLLDPFQWRCSSLPRFVLLRLVLHLQLTMPLHKPQENATLHKRSPRALVYR